MHYDKAIDDRLRRIETKLTRLIIALGVESQTPPSTPAERPADGHHNVPSPEPAPTCKSATTALFRGFPWR